MQNNINVCVSFQLWFTILIRLNKKLCLHTLPGPFGRHVWYYTGYNEDPWSRSCFSCHRKYECGDRDRSSYRLQPYRKCSPWSAGSTLRNTTGEREQHILKYLMKSENGPSLQTVRILALSSDHYNSWPESFNQKVKQNFILNSF